MLSDKHLASAISNIAQRAERIIENDRVVKTYVEVGILPQVANANNQIIYGRRGTGKTHLFRYLENHLKAESKKPIVVYIDCRTLGSASEYNNKDNSLERRCFALFKDIIDNLAWTALTFIAEEAPVEAEKAMISLSQISEATQMKQSVPATKEVTERTVDKAATESSANITLSLTNPEFTVGGKKADGIDIEKTSKYTIDGGDKVHFPDLHYSLKTLTEHADAQIFLLIDEWSSLPTDIQPFLAEFIKRSFLPIAQITVKIAALEYRSNFRIQMEQGAYIGFDLGADIATHLDLDDYFVFDRNPEAITGNFAEILYRHVLNEMPEEGFERSYGIKSGADFIRTIFADSNNFQELVRASEGVIRDMLNIFTLSFFYSQRQGKEKIDKKSIIESSRQWFERDKSNSLDDSLRETLRLIVDEVIGKKRARSFLIPRELEKHEKIQRLFDARVIHFITRGYADKDNPGLRYDVFGLDYGTYVDLLTTNKKPELNFVDIDEREDEAEFIVPFDDKRSIRRIILTREILEQTVT